MFMVYVLLLAVANACVELYYQLVAESSSTGNVTNYLLVSTDGIPVELHSMVVSCIVIVILRLFLPLYKLRPFSVDPNYSMSKQLLFVRNNRNRRDLLKYFVSLQRKSQKQTLVIHRNAFGIQSIRRKRNDDSDGSSVSVDSRESSDSPTELNTDLSLSKTGKTETFPSGIYWADSAGVPLKTLRSEAETNPSLELNDSNLTVIERSRESRRELKDRMHRRQFSNTDELGAASMHLQAHKQSLDYSRASQTSSRRKKRPLKTPSGIAGDEWMFVE